MAKPQPADFFTPLEEIIAPNLTHRLIIGIEKFKGTREEKNKEIEKLLQAVEQFMISGDHGIKHSRQVLARIIKIFAARPHLLCQPRVTCFKPEIIKALLTWASLLHDFSRFLGYSSVPEHQLASAKLAYACFIDDQPDIIAEILFSLIRHHDYLSPISSGEDLPFDFAVNPLAEIFRLADKTTLPPAGELERYYQTGKRLGGVFFDPKLTLEERFAFDWTKSDGWDFLNFFLVLFTITPQDWFRSDCSDLYRAWEQKDGGKYEAIQRIFQMAYLENLPSKQSQEINYIITKFFRHFELPYPY